MAKFFNSERDDSWESQRHTVPCSVAFQSPGVLEAEVFEYTPGIQAASLSTYLKTNVFLFLFALGFYLLLRLLDIDLLWSVPIAKKWCTNPDWIHIDTTPFASLVRNLGVLFGLGFAIHSELFLRSCQGEHGCRLSFRLQAELPAALPAALCPGLVDRPAALPFHQDPHWHRVFVLRAVLLQKCVHPTDCGCPDSLLCSYVSETKCKKA